MKNFNILLVCICHFACIFLVGADVNLRGTNTTVIQDNANEASSENETHDFNVEPSLSSVRRELNIFGSDDRRSFKDSSWPWSAVGKVQTAAASCTGTMVGARLMLTAQHCLDRRSDGSLRWIKFTPAYYDGDAPYGSAKAEHVWWDHKIPRKEEHYDSEFAWDYMVVKFDQRIGDKTGWWGFKVYNSEWNGED